LDHPTHDETNTMRLKTQNLLTGMLAWGLLALTGCPPAAEEDPTACQAGYAAGADGQCADIDECATGAAGCAAGETCTNTPGSFECEPENTGCGPGYDDKGNGLCIDLNECDLGTDNCSPDASCLNLTGSFQCQCKSGFTGDGVTCTSMGCEPGYKKSGALCIDANECDEGTDNCSENAVCSNLTGSFSCRCSSGFTGDGVTCVRDACQAGYMSDGGGRCLDIDECATNQFECDPNARCSNFTGGYSCRCKNGYEGDGKTCAEIPCQPGFEKNANGTCFDINECQLNTDNCAATANCYNTPGSFSCVCKNGYTGSGTSCAPEPCPTGFERNASGSCVDTNECLSPGACSPGQTCVNQSGTFRCDSAASCQPGFQPSGSSCVDINECATGANNCDANATCINAQGNFMCVCKNGFAGDGVTCDLGACQPGYQRTAAGACADLNECALGTNDCSPDATCANTAGSFTCRCNTGFAGDGRTCAESPCQAGYQKNAAGACVDVNECAAAGACPAGQSCVNTAGSFTCNAGPMCQPGFQNVNGNCSDINECMTGANTCDPNANCANTSGSFRCTCKTGFTGDGMTCTDVDECATGTPCGANGICTNTPGAFTCGCEPGYKSISATRCGDIDECNDASAGFTCDALCRDLPGSAQCLSTVADPSSPYWRYACRVADDRYINNPTNFDMDCRCATAQVGRPTDPNHPDFAEFDRCTNPTSLTIRNFGSGPSVLDWIRNLSATSGATRMNGGFLDANERMVYVGAQWSDNRAFNGNPDLKNFGVVFAINVDWDSPAVGDRIVISGKYLTSNGDADVGSGPTLRSVKEVKRGPDGMLYTYSDEAGTLPQIMKIDPATGNRTLVWIEKEIYHPTAMPADQCDNGSITGNSQGGLNGNRRSLQINIMANPWAMSPVTGDHFFSVTQAGPARGPYGVIKISADGSTCEWVTRFAANSPNRFAEITNVAQRPADYGLPAGSGPRGGGLSNYGNNPVNLHWRIVNNVPWLYMVNGTGSGATGMKYYRVNALTGDRELLFSDIMGDMFSVWDESRQVLWTAGVFMGTIITPMNILGLGGQPPGVLGNIRCLSTTSPWYQCMRGAGDTGSHIRGGIFIDPLDDNLIMAHGGRGLVRVEVKTGNSYIFSL
jgi:hypothetical protein